jgi:hypothetical protein
MQKRSLFIFIVGAILLTSCSASEVLRGVGLEEDDEVTPQSCPLAAVPNYHSIKLITSIAIPAKLAVILDGQLKYDECLEKRVILPAPIVDLYRSVGAVSVQVRHFDGYSGFPANVSYELLDRGDCTGNPISFYVANQIPLVFKKINYDVRPECGGYYKAEVILQQ